MARHVLIRSHGVHFLKLMTYEEEGRGGGVTHLDVFRVIQICYMYHKFLHGFTEGSLHA